MKYSISDLSDDLLLKILLSVPTKDAIATTFLSKRWRYVWTMLPVLEYKDERNQSFWVFIDKSLQLHKAPKLNMLNIQIGLCSPSNVNAEIWVDTAINRCVSFLNFDLLCGGEPTKFPKNLYICETLVGLHLSNNILVDVSSRAHLPSLKHLRLTHAFYKDEDSFFNLVSSSPILETLTVKRRRFDNLFDVTVYVPSLKELSYCVNWLRDEEHEINFDVYDGLLVIDCRALEILRLQDICEEYISMENMPCLELAYIDCVIDVEKDFLRSLTSVKYMVLCWTESMVEIFYALFL